MRARAVGLLAGLASCASPALERFEFERPAMGTTFRIVLHATSGAAAERAASAAFARIAELDRLLSDYDAASELSRLSARSDERAPTEAIPVSQDLFRVLGCAQEVALESRGAFDVTVGPYVRLWRRARRRGELPRAEELAAAAPAVGFEKLELAAGSRVVLLAPAMRLDLGGIAKGYALDEALAVLREQGMDRALVVGGGELRAGAPAPGRSGWRVEIVGLESPVERVELVDQALATSGDLEQALELDGVRYSHILDPRTGAALTERRLVSVLAPSGILADALATAISVLGPEEGLALAARMDSVEARVLVRRGATGREAPGTDRTEVFRSPGFPGALSCARPALSSSSNQGPSSP